MIAPVPRPPRPQTDELGHDQAGQGEDQVGEVDHQEQHAEHRQKDDADKQHGAKDDAGMGVRSSTWRAFPLCAGRRPL
jgi:hypothetical protein